MIYPYPPALPIDELAVIAGVLRGSSKLTDPHDIHCAWSVAGYGASVLFPDQPAAAAMPANGALDTPQDVARHIEEGLAAQQSAVAFNWNWAAILKILLALLSAVGA